MTGRRRRPLAERIEDMSMPEPMSGCVLWLGALDAAGYGRIRVGPGVVRMSHVVAYELGVGPIPTGMDLDHLCRNRACRAEWHLEPVTRRVNLLRGIGFPAQNAAKTHCKRGHRFDEANTSLYRGRHRHCLTCRKMRDAGLLDTATARGARGAS
jgi:hypothetical protein